MNGHVIENNDNIVQTQSIMGRASNPPCAGRYIAQGHVTKNQPITVPIFCNGEVSLELPEVFSDLLQYGARVGVLEDANKGCCCRRSNYLFRFVQSVASNEH